MSHTPLGEVCQALGLMSGDQVEQILGRLRSSSRARFGEIAIELGFLDDDGLARALAHQFRLNMVPPERLSRLSIAPEVLALLPPGLVRERLLLPTFLDEEKRVLSLLTTDPTDIPSLRAAQAAARAARLRLFVAPRGAMRDLVERLLPPDEPVRPPDRLASDLDPDAHASGITVVYEPDTERASALRRLAQLEGGNAEIVGDPEQVSAFIEANQADRVFFRRPLLPQVEPYLDAWRRLRPLVQICALDGYGPGRRVAIPYERTRDFFVGLLGHLLADREGADGLGGRTVELARVMAEEANLPLEQRDTVVLGALFWGIAAAESGQGEDEAATLLSASTLLRAWAPPYEVQQLFDALLPRLRGEAGPGTHAGAEMLFTARAAVRAALGVGDDPVAALGGDVARHDAAALAALAGVLRRRGLKLRVAGVTDAAARPHGARIDDDGDPISVIEPAPDPSAANLPALLGALRRVLRRRSEVPPAVAGRLAELSLPELLQTLTLGGRTARVLVLGGAERGDVQVRAGRIVAATHGARAGEAALQSLVATAEGRFEVRFEDSGASNLVGSSELLLLEALRRRDEARA